MYTNETSWVSELLFWEDDAEYKRVIAALVKIPDTESVVDIMRRGRCAI